jgi:hypothetical protein
VTGTVQVTGFVNVTPRAPNFDSSTVAAQKLAWIPA